jgi:hypothetical protein
MLFARHNIKATILSFILIFCFNKADSWGFWAHRKINNKAIATLPEEMKGFYFYYSDYITDHSVDPDKKRFCVVEEAPHHYIDLDHYFKNSYDSMPRRWTEAVQKYTIDTLNKYGTLPWYICLEYNLLVQAFKDTNPDQILKLSSHLGHYISDSYVPLHSTLNYDGQYTGQWGIHSFWESTVPELMGKSFNYKVNKAKFISNINAFAWMGPLSSAPEADSVLAIERTLHAEFPFEKMYCIEFNRQDQPFLKFSEEYSIEYNKRLNGMVERRIRSSIYATGCIWLSAWIDAGQPDLNQLIGKASLDYDYNDEE